MAFSSLEFLFLFLTLTLFLYFIIPPKFLKWRNIILLITNLIFFGWGKPVYVFLMIFTVSIDYICGYFIDKTRDTNRGKAKFLLILSVVINLVILVFFKYYDFLRTIPGLSNLPYLGLDVSVGISIYTLQALSYVFDVYRNDAKVQKNVVSLGTYIAIYPKLIAGPVVKYKDADNMLTERKESIALFASGVRTFLAGLAKKVFFADIAGKIWESYKTLPTDQRSIVGCWIGLICFAFQIYFYLSAYSDMAMGLGKMIGFKFPENFNYPYVSTSITDFWNRWYISLTAWFKEYVYIPLGGNSGSVMKDNRNILIVWLLIGLWHGAGWNYILWGLYYCVLLIIEKAFLLEKLARIPAFFRHLYTVFFVLFGWILFAFEDLGAGMTYLGNMFGSGVSASLSQMNIYDISRNFIFFVIMLIAVTPFPKKIFYKFYEKSQIVKLAAYMGGAAVLIFSIAYLTDSSYNPLSYFRF